jgi:hypothetical protein
VDSRGTSKLFEKVHSKIRQQISWITLLSELYENGLDEMERAASAESVFQYDVIEKIELQLLEALENEMLSFKLSTSFEEFCDRVLDGRRRKSVFIHPLNFIVHARKTNSFSFRKA